ncbi:MAG TPA: universal stress protein [Pseudomonadales bacterium]
MGKHYQRVLVALALHESDAGVLERALSVVSADAELDVLHVCEHHVSRWSAGAGSGVHNPEMMERESAFPVLKALLARFGVDVSRLHIENGKAADHIDDYARRLNADLIVVGGHSKSGWQAHLGSVANAVVNHAPCDVLIVRTRH